MTTFWRLTQHPCAEVTTPWGIMTSMSISRSFIAGVAGLSLLVASCGSDEPASDAANVVPSEALSEVGSDVAGVISGLSTISVDEAAAITANPPADLIVLDVRTPEEFAEGHLAGALLVDFYDADFAEQLTALDRDVPYLVYCRSDNRSGQALGVMGQLGFSSVADVDGGIVAWNDAGLPVTTD